MRRKSLLCLLGAFLVYFLFVGTLFAQDKPVVPDKPVVQEQPRIIEESLVIQDPTVAQPKKWLIGGSGDLWWVYGPYNRYYSDGTTYSKGNINGGMYGGTIYAGYDNLTLSYSYRKGSWDITSEFPDYPGASSTLTRDQAEQEFTARWLFRVSPHFNPYVIVGYNYTTRTDTEVLGGGYTWVYNGLATKIEDFTYKSPLVGLGAIIPFNKYIGLRIDGRLLYSWADYKLDNGYSLTGSGFGGAIVGTFYWNIWQGLNLQIGGKFQYLNGGSDIGYDAKAGVYGMLGYTFKF